MVSKQHCPVCGFLMMYSLEEGKVIYTCPNQSHETTGEASKNVHMHDNYELGPNLDVLMRWIKNPGYEE